VVVKSLRKGRPRQYVSVAVVYRGVLVRQSGVGRSPSIAMALDDSLVHPNGLPKDVQRASALVRPTLGQALLLPNSPRVVS